MALPYINRDLICGFDERLSGLHVTLCLCYYSPAMSPDDAAAATDFLSFERESDSLTYTNIKSAGSPWRRAPFISIAVAGSAVSVEPIRIPLPFLEGSGDNTWEFVAFLLEQIIEGKGGVIVNDATDSEVNLSDAPTEGNYTYHPRNGSRSWSRGPQGSRVFRAPIDGEGWDDRNSTASADSDTSVRYCQNISLRLLLLTEVSIGTLLRATSATELHGVISSVSSRANTRSRQRI